VSYRVEVKRGTDYTFPCARIFIGQEQSPRFTIVPLTDSCSKILIFDKGLPPTVERRIWVDERGVSLPGSDGGYGEDFGWLLDLAQEAGLDFPALHGG
jgi:hypothetical protein